MLTLYGLPHHYDRLLKQLKGPYYILLSIEKLPLAVLIYSMVMLFY